MPCLATHIQWPIFEMLEDLVIWLFQEYNIYYPIKFIAE